MEEREIIGKIEKVFKSIVAKTGLISPGSISEQVREPLFSDNRKPDLVYVVNTQTGNKYTLIFEIKNIGLPKYVRMAANQLQEIIGERKRLYGIFGAPYVSEESEKICRSSNIGYLDLAGNCFFSFDGLYINIKGNPNPFPEKRPIKSIFSKKSSRITRILLDNPGREWYVKDLANEAGISIGLVSKVKKRLEEYNYIEKSESQKFYLSNPESLLQRWLKNYSYKKNSSVAFYSLNDIKTIEKNLADFCDSNDIRYAFTLTSGASRIAPFLRYNKVFAYIEDSVESIAKDLGWEKVSTGANISILSPYDSGIFYGLQKSESLKIVSDIQLYLDLKNYKQRGEEAAEFLKEKRLEPKWQKNRTIRKKK